MKFAAVLLFPLLMGLMGTQGGNVGAEGVRGKHYDAYYPLFGLVATYFFKTVFSAARSVELKVEPGLS
jgi:hypothetical protein